MSSGHGSAFRKKRPSWRGSKIDRTNVSMTFPLHRIRWDGLFPDAAAACDLLRFAPLHQGKSILVTGAGGSIGSPLSHAIYQLRPSVLVLLDSSEQNLYYIHRDLSEISSATTLIPVLGSVADAHCLSDVFRQHPPQLIYHAAALKHVPLGELNPFALVQTNVIGTSTLAGFAQQTRCERLVMISTDKSVLPRSIMGASKRVAEIQLSRMSTTHARMTSIRLGNVLGSEGSVVPLFLQQIARGGPVTVTDPDAERYFLTIEATVQRVVATAATCPTETAVAVPIMGEPVKIVDLARHLIGQSDNPNVEISFTGLRPGDKLREEFICAGETACSPVAEGIQWFGGAPSSQDVSLGLAEMDRAIGNRDLNAVLDVLGRLVPEYQPSNLLVQQADAVR